MSRGKRYPAPDDTLSIALSLARAGWPVFPVTIYKGDDGKRHKVPAVPRGTSWVDWATTDPEKIATAWSGESAGCWIGVHVGAAGLVVLDVDREPDDGRKSLKRAGLVPPPTFSYKTLGGGRHHLYAAPAGMALTNAQGLMHDGERLKGVDVRGGNGLFVYYGPELNPRGATHPGREVTPAPEWLLVPATPKAADRAPTADEAAWRDRLTPGKPKKKTRRMVESTDFPAGASHAPMLEVVTALVQLGQRGERGIGALLDETRERYVGTHPDRGRDWDNALAGSIKRIGLPPLTFEITSAEKEVIARRNSPKGIEAAKIERKAAFVTNLIEIGEGQLTDAAVAEVLIEELRGEWANAPGVGLLRYDGVVWTPTDEALLIERVRRMLRKVRAEVTRAAILRGDTRTEQEAKTLESRTHTVAIARFIAGMLLETAPRLDADPDVLNVQNGVVDLRTGELRTRRADDYFTKVTNAEYHPGASSPEWQQALKALPGSTRAWLKVRLGQAATGRISVDKSIPFCLGGGDNGKSAVLGGVRHALGTYAVTVPERLLLGSDNDHPTDIMTLEGARLAIFEELPRGGRLNAQRIKLLAGTNRLSGRKMRMDFREFVATHTLVGATNHLPMITDVDDAIWNRVAPVPFPYKFVEPYRPATDDDLGAPGPKPGTNQRNADMTLRDRLAEADDLADGVLAWLVEGAVESYRGIPPKPKYVSAAWEEWRGEADPVLGFVRDHLELAGDDVAIAATDLYTEFGTYLERRGQQRWSDQLIATSFTGHSALDGVEKRKVLFGGSLMPSRPAFTMKPIPPRAMAWVGLRFRAEAAPAPLTPEEADLNERMTR